MIILPTLHILLRLFKKCVKAMNKNGAGFHNLKEKSPYICDFKIKDILRRC